MRSFRNLDLTAAGCIYVPEDFAKKYPNTAQAVVRGGAGLLLLCAPVLPMTRWLAAEHPAPGDR
jgi:hypothetical protein